MARLKAVSEQDASPEVRSVYDRVKARFGKLVEPVSVTAAHPEIFKAFIAYEASLRSASRVSAKLKEIWYIHEHVFPLVLERLRGTPVRARDVVSGASERLLSTRLNQKWSAKEHLGHLSDLHSLEERRLREFLANASTLSPADPMNRATETADHNQRSIGAVLGLLRVYRAEFVAKLENLNEKDLCRTAIHPRLQTPMRMLDWMYFIAEHDDHHLAKAHQVLRELRFYLKFDQENQE